MTFINLLIFFKYRDWNLSLKIRVYNMQFNSLQIITFFLKFFL